MSLDLQRIPRGLLSLLGIQAQGVVNPKELIDQLLPMIDLTPFYLANNDELVRDDIAATAATAAQFFAAATVPTDEIWVVKYGSILATSASGATGTINVHLAATRFDANLERNIVVGDAVAFGNFFPDAYGREMIYFAPPNTRLGTRISINGLSGGTVEIETRFIVNKLRL